MIRLFGITLYWPGEASLRRDLDDHRMALETSGRFLAEAMAKMKVAQNDVVRLTNEVLKARDTYAGPLLAYRTADGTGYALDSHVLGYRLQRGQEFIPARTLGGGGAAGFPGQVSMTATVTVDTVTIPDIFEAHHVEWQGVKWMVRRVNHEQERDILPGGYKGLRTDLISIDLEAFVDPVKAGQP